jgi:hypothetical protein
MSAAANTSLTSHRPRRMRVLLANELRYYREAIAEALRLLRPEVEVTTVEPADLDSSIRHLASDMVVCTEATDAVRENVPVWVELYPGHEAHSVVSIEGKREEYAEMEFPDLLSIVDLAADLAR